MRRKVIVILAWVQIVVSGVLIAASPMWLQVDMEQGERLFLAVAYLVFGVAFLIDAVRDLERYRVKQLEEPEGVGAHEEEKQ